MNTYTDTEITFHQAIACELSSITGDKWIANTSTTSERSELIKSGEGDTPRILIRGEQTLQFIGWYYAGEKPIGGRYGESIKTSINCSRKKSASRIAKEIADRLLPEYLPEWEKRYAYYLSDVKYAEKKKDLAVKLYALLGKPLLGIEKRASDDYYIPKTAYSQGLFTAKTVDGLDFVSSDELTLTLRLTGDQAEKVIKLLIENNL
jgi:hypothetical protein